jgi:hypothetical protein
VVLGGVNAPSETVEHDVYYVLIANADEHGSDPALFWERGAAPWNFGNDNEQGQPFLPPFGYAGGATGMHEAHTGFKVYALQDVGGNYWMFVHHQGTARASCRSAWFHRRNTPKATSRQTA